MDAAFLCIAKRPRHARIGHAEHEVGIDGKLAGQNAFHGASSLVDALPIDGGIGAGEINVLENAAARLFGLDGLQRGNARIVDADDLARLHVAHEFGAHDVEAARLARNHPAAFVGKLAQAQRANAVRVAESVQRRGARQHHGIGAVDHFHGRFDALRKMVRLARVIANDLARNLGIGIAAEFDALANEIGANAIRVHQRAVMRQRDEHLVDGRHMRLGACPTAHAAARRVAAMSHGDLAPKRGERALVEHLGHQAEVLRDRDRIAIAHGDARALLAAMLQSLQAEAGQPRHVVGG